jgi:hypothetical protein
MTTAAAVAVSSSVESSHPESITPTFPVEHGRDRNESHQDDTSQIGDDWWNEDLLLRQDYDPFRPTTTATTSIYDLHQNENGVSQSLPFRIIRQPPKLKSFPSSNKTIPSSLRIQDVLERLDLDQTTTTPEAVIVDHSDCNNNNNTGSSTTIDHNDHKSWTSSDNQNDTFDSYFWNTKSPCKWNQHHHHHHHPKSKIHIKTTNHKRPRYSPRQQTSSSLSPQILVEWGTTTMTNDFTLIMVCLLVSLVPPNIISMS